MQCVACSVQCAVFSVQSAVFSVQCVLLSVKCVVCSAHCDNRCICFPSSIPFSDDQELLLLLLIYSWQAQRQSSVTTEAVISDCYSSWIWTAGLLVLDCWIYSWKGQRESSGTVSQTAGLLLWVNGGLLAARAGLLGLFLTRYRGSHQGMGHRLPDYCSVWVLVNNYFGWRYQCSS